MTLRESQLTGRLRLRHLQEVHEAHSEVMDVQRQRFDRLANKTSAPRVVSAFNLFQTPEPLAARMAQLIADHTGRLLEPSAGLGRLYRAAREEDPTSHVTLVEQSAECCAELYRDTEHDTASRLIQGDFLEQSSDKLGFFPAILMNPPFKMGRDIQHINHALTFLTPGGRLVAICANGPKQNNQLKPLATSWEVLPVGSFKEAATNVSAVLFLFDK